MLCEVCGRRMRKGYEYCTTCKCRITEQDEFSLNGYCWTYKKVNKNRYKYSLPCIVIFTKYELIVISNYRDPNSRGTGLLNYAISVLRDKHADNPIIKVPLSEIAGITIKGLESFFFGN